MLPHIICTGSYEFLPYAKSKGRQVLANALLLGGHGNLRQTLPDGGTLSITVALPSTYRIILMGGAEMLSGVIATGDYVAYQNPVTGNTLYSIDSFEPSSLQVAGPPLAARTWRQEKKLGDTARNVFSAERFTGKMRMAMQLFYGTKHDPEEYRSDFYVSHGIHVDITGKHWLIEVSAYGVLAKPMGGNTIKAPAAVNTGAKAAGMSLVLNGKAFYRDPVSPDFKQPDYKSFKTLLSPQAMQAVCFNTNIFAVNTSIGWAFNYSGKKVSNIALWLEDGNIKSGLFTIEIAGDDTGPTSATISLIESGFFKDYEIAAEYFGDSRYYLRTNTITHGRGALHGFPNQARMGVTSVAKNLELTGPVFCYYIGDDIQLWHCESKDHVFDGVTLRYVGFTGPGITGVSVIRDSIVVSETPTAADGPLFSLDGSPPPVPVTSVDSVVKLFSGYGPDGLSVIGLFARYATFTDSYTGVRSRSAQTGLSAYRSVNFSGVNREAAYVYQHDKESGGLTTSSGEGMRTFAFTQYVMLVQVTSPGSGVDQAYADSQLSRALASLSQSEEELARSQVIKRSLGYWNVRNQAPLSDSSTLTVLNHDEVTVYSDLGECRNRFVGEYCGKSAFLGSSYHYRLRTKPVGVFTGSGVISDYLVENVFKPLDNEDFVGHVGLPTSFSYPNRDKFGFPLAWVGYS